MMLAIFTDDMKNADRMCGELLADFPDDDPYLRGSVELCLLYSQRELFRLDSVDRLDLAARGYFERARSQFVMIWHESILGPALVQRGDLDRAADGYQSAIGIANSIGGRGNPMGAMPALLLAEVLMERGEYDGTRALWDAYLPVCEEIGLVDQLIAAYIGSARLAFLFGDEEIANARLARAVWFAKAKPFDRLLAHATAESIRQAALRNDVQRASRIANEAKMPRDATALYPGDGATTRTEALAVAWIRLALARGQAKEAESLAKRWVTFASQRSCVHTEIRMGILVAAARLASDDARGAKRALTEALVLSIPRGLILPYLEEGEAVKKTLADMFDIPLSGQTVDEFSRDLTVKFKANPDRVLVHARGALEPRREGPSSVEGHLTQREIEILSFVAQGLQNKEIGDRLSLAEGSVKWYMQQIFIKLGVRRRLTAFQKAKALGLIR
jgi:LuxR family maltose regulon positive regulatory protein